MTEVFDLSVLFKMVDRFSNPLKQAALNLVNWEKKLKKADNTLVNQFGNSLKNIGDKIKSTGTFLSTHLTAPLTAFGLIAVHSALQSEQAFTGVVKTVNATGAELAELKTKLMGLARKIPLLTNEIYGIGEAAGQLGIKTKNIVSFTKVMADLGATTNMTANEAATQLARFANVTNMSQKDFSRLGSAIVALGNNTATTEAEITDMMLRLGGAGNTIGLTQSQIAGLAATLSSLGIRSEAGGTAFSQLMRRIDKEIGTGSNLEKGFAAISGKTVKKFRKAWKDDAINPLLDFIKGLKKLNDEGKNVNVILDQMKFDGARLSDVLLRTAAGSEKLVEYVNLSNKAWEENIALTREANLRYRTSASQLKIMGNIVKQTATSFGAAFVPAIIKFLKFLQPTLDVLAGLSPATKQWIGVIGLVVAALGPLTLAVGAFTAAVGTILANTAIASIIGAIGIAFVGLGVGIASVVKHWKDLKREFSTSPWDSINDMISALTGGLLLPTAERNKRIDQWFSSNNTENTTQVKIEVSADDKSSAVVKEVKSTGKVQVINNSELGMVEGY